jgi:hypothetical protein
VDGEDIIRNCYERHKIHLKVEFGRLTKVRNRKNAIGIYTWQSWSVTDINWACKTTTNNIQKQNLFAAISQKNPLFSGELQ